MAKRIRSKLPGKKSLKIRPGKLDDTKTLKFSFKYLDINHPKFSVTAKDGQYFSKVLERLKKLSELKVIEILRNRSSSLRAHPIKWRETTEPRGFQHLNEQLQSETPYQIQISANAHGRVHGFFLEDTFFIVWFDPDHNLYTRLSGLKKCSIFSISYRVELSVYSVFRK